MILILILGSAWGKVELVVLVLERGGVVILVERGKACEEGFDIGIKEMRKKRCYYGISEW